MKERELNQFESMTKDQQLEIIRWLLNYNNIHVLVYKDDKVNILPGVVIGSGSVKEIYTYNKNDFDFTNTNQYLDAWNSLVKRYIKVQEEFEEDKKRIDKNYIKITEMLSEVTNTIYKAQSNFIADLVLLRLKRDNKI